MSYNASTLTRLKRSLRETAEAHHLAGMVRIYRRAFSWYMSFKSNEYIFNEIYLANAWGDPESRSGTGSGLERTRHIREAMPGLLRKLNVHSILDAPCGDFNWMQHVDLAGIEYIGADVVTAIVEANQSFTAAHRRFVRLDMIKDELPLVDLIFCRDALTHFPYKAITKTISNFKRSGATYLLTTTHRVAGNLDVPIMSYWRPLNFEKPPFNFPQPLFVIDDCGAESDTKSLALWKLADL